MLWVDSVARFVAGWRWLSLWLYFMRELFDKKGISLLDIRHQVVKHQSHSVALRFFIINDYHVYVYVYFFLPQRLGNGLFSSFTHGVFYYKNNRTKTYSKQTTIFPDGKVVLPLDNLAPACHILCIR